MNDLKLGLAIGRMLPVIEKMVKNMQDIHSGNAWENASVYISYEDKQILLAGVAAIKEQ